MPEHLHRLVLGHAAAPDGAKTRVSHRTARVERRCDAKHEANGNDGTCTETEVDGFGRLVERRTFIGNSTTRYAYDTHTYDLAGREVTVKQNNSTNGSTVATLYDGLGRRRQVTDANSGVWVYSYDANGNMVTVDDPVAGQHLTFRYDPLNRLRSRIAHVQKPQGNFCRVLATFQYDASPGGKGRLSRVDDRSGATLVRGYTRRGSPTSVETTIRFRGRTETFVQTNAYDAIGRLATRTLPFGPLTTSETLHFTYSAQGAVEKVRSDHGAFVRNVDHDDLGRAVRVDYGSFAWDTFDFRDAVGRPLFQTTPELGGAYQPYRFATTGGDGSLLRDVVYADYSPTGRILSIQDSIPHGLVEPSVTQVAGYDALSRLTLSSQLGGDPATSLGTYAYDNYGRVTSKDGVAYAYDDPARVYQLTSVGGEPVGYDANGSMTELPGGRMLFYDPEGRLAEVRENDFVVAQYLYDHRGARVAAYEPLEGRRTLYFDDFEVHVEAGTVVRHIRLGDRLVASSPLSMGSSMARAEPDVRVAGHAFVTLVALVLGVALAVPGRGDRRGTSRRSAALLAGVLILSDIVIPAVSFAGCPDPRDAVPPDGTVFYHLDHLGGPQLLTNRIGAPLEYRVERPYGTNGGTYDGSGTPKLGSSGQFGFTGHRLADASGLIYMGARFFDPGLGMFVSHDPAAQFANPYSYGGGDPLNGRDPSGADFGAALALIIVTYLVLPQTAGSIQALVGGASATQAFIAGGRTILYGLAGAGGAGLVGGLVAPGLSQAFALVSYGLAIAGVAAAAAGGNWQAIAVTAAALGVGMAVSALVSAGQGAADRVPAQYAGDREGRSSLDDAQSLYGIVDTEPNGQVESPLFDPIDGVAAAAAGVVAGARVAAGAAGRGFFSRLLARLGLRTLSQSEVEVTAAGLRHTIQRHTVGGLESAGRSVFSDPGGVAGLIRGAGSVAPVPQPNGYFARIVDAGRLIGIDRATGLPTTQYTVITDSAGRLITAYPGVP